MAGKLWQKADRRSGIERRRFVYSDYYPERRSGKDRRRKQKRRRRRSKPPDSQVNVS